MSGAPGVEFRQGGACPSVNRGPAVVRALGTVQVVGDVAHALKIARPAVGAAFHATIGGQAAFEGFGQIAVQPFLGHATVQVIPRQRFVEQPAPQIVVRVDAVAGERLLPQFEPELLGPAVEPAARTVGRQQRRPEPAVAAREDAFQKRQPRVVPFELDAVAAQFAAQQALARLGFVQIHLPRPLKRRMRFRDEGRDAGRHLPLMFAGRGHLAAQLDDAEQVFLGLGRLAEHEIQFHALPAESEQQPRRIDQLVFLILLLDHVAQPLGAGLGRQREAGFPHAADLLQDVRRERVHARGR